MTPDNSFGSTVLGVFALVWGSWRIWRGGDRRKALLMLVVALVLVGNILIQTL